MNLVHRVGVIFHGNDRLTRHMNRIGDKFIGLEAKQHAWEQAQKRAAKTEAALEKTKQRNSARERVAVMQQMRLDHQVGVSRTRLQQLEERLNDARAAGVDLLRDRQAAAEAAMTAAREKHARKRASLSSTYRKREERAETAHAKSLASKQVQLDKDQARRTLMQQKQVKRLGDSEIERVVQRLAQNKAHEEGLQKLRAEKMANAGHTLTRGPGGEIVRTPMRVHDPTSRRADADGYRPMTVDEMRRAREFAAKPIDKRLQKIKGAIATDEKLLTQHAQLVELNKKIARQEKDIHDAKRKHEADRKKAFEQHKKDWRDLYRLQQQAREAQARGDQEAYARAQKLHAAKMESIEQQVAAQHTQATHAERMHTAQMSALNAERDARKRLLDDTQKQVDAERAATVEMERRVQLANRLNAWWGGSAAMVGSGAGTAMTGGMILGGVGYAGHKLSHKAADFEQKVLELDQTLRAEPGWAKRLTELVLSNDSRIEGGVRMGSVHQLEILQDLVSAGVKPAEAGKMLTPMAQAVTLAQLRGRYDKRMTMDAATVLERLGLIHGDEAAEYLDRFAQGIGVSKRLSFKYMAEFLSQVSPIARAMDIDLTNMPDYEYFAALNPAGGTSGRQIGSVLTMLARGGSNNDARAIFKNLADRGHFKWAAKPQPQFILDDNGKRVPLLDADGNQMTLPGVLSFKREDGTSMGLVETLDTMRDAILGGLGVDHDTWVNNKMSDEQRARMNQFLNKTANAKTGVLPVATVFDPVKYKQFQQEQKLTAAAPGLAQQLAEFDGKYNMNTMRFAAALQELGMVAGQELLTPMGKLVTQLTEMADATRIFIKENPKFIPMMLEGALALGKWTVALGAAKIAFGGLNFMLLGLPKLLTSTVGGMFTRLATQAPAFLGSLVTRIFSPAALAAAGGIAGRLGLGTVVSGLLGTFFLNAIKLALGPVALAVTAHQLTTFVGSAFQRGLEQSGIADAVQNYFARVLPDWMTGRNTEQEQADRQALSTRLGAKYGMSGEQYEAYVEQRRAAVAEGKQPPTPYQAVASIVRDQVAGQGPVAPDVVRKNFDSAFTTDTGRASLQQALNPMGGYTLGRQDKLIVEFQGQAPPGLNLRQLEQSIVQNATRGGIGSRQMPGPLPSGIAGAY